MNGPEDGGEENTSRDNRGEPALDDFIGPRCSVVSLPPDGPVAPRIVLNFTENFDSDDTYYL
jgi:hypothetical protein